MTDNAFGQPPPEGRLTHEQRARMRAGLWGATQPAGGPRRRWAVPVAAAASVALLVTGAAVVSLLVSDRGGSGAPAPAGQGTATPTETSVEPAPPTVTAGEDRAVGQGACDRAVADYLPGAEVRADYLYGDGFHTWLYATADRWVICDRA